MKKPIRLSATEAARAAGCDRKTLLARLSAAREEPGADGRFTLAQIVRALTSGLADARRRHAAAQAEMAELELERARGELVHVDEMRKVCDAGFDRIRAAVLNASIPRSDRHALMRALLAAARGDTAESHEVNTPEQSDS